MARHKNSKLSKAGRILQSPCSTKKQKSNAAKELNRHKKLKH
ncbi:hypothetical protein [Rummeliibacillus suwonensis]|nr:hypothetical protein [Rummeliibacillus suwonensis]